MAEPPSAHPAAGADDRRHRLRRRRRASPPTCARSPPAACTAAWPSPRSPCRTRSASPACTRSRRRRSPRRSRPSPPTSGWTRPRPGCSPARRSSRRSRRPATGPGSAPAAAPRWWSTRWPRRCTATRCSPTPPSTRSATLLFPRATLITPNLDEVRLLVGIDVHDRAAQYEAAKALHGLGPAVTCWSRAGTWREDTDGCVDLLYDGAHLHRAARPAVRHRQHPRRRRQHGRGRSRPGWPAGCRCPTPWRWPSATWCEAVRHSYPLGAGHGPVSPLWAVRRVVGGTPSARLRRDRTPAAVGN